MEKHVRKLTFGSVVLVQGKDDTGNAGVFNLSFLLKYCIAAALGSTIVSRKAGCVFRIACASRENAS